MNELPKALSAELLRQTCDAAAVRAGAAEPSAESALIGQDRALRAIRLAIESRHADFNLFVLGPPGTGRHTEVARVLHGYASEQARPPDWAYVNNFDDPHRPHALRLPAGLGNRLRQEMELVVDDLAGDIPALFESEEYQAQRRAIEEEFSSRQEEAMAEFEERARHEDVALVRTPLGFMVAALRNGEIVKTEEYEKLPEEDQAEIDQKIPRFQEELSEVLQKAPKLEREQRGRVEALNAEMAERAVSARVSEAAETLGDVEEIATYLAKVRIDMVEHPELFLKASAQKNDGPFPAAVGKSHLEPAFRRYRVNVVVAHSAEGETSAPVVTEDLPTLDRLAGRIEHVSHMGSLVTDFTLIRPGALHQANGGFLVLDARRVLSEPFAWDALKRSLKTRSVTITSMAERMSLVSTTSLEPDPIPLDLKVVLVGDRLLHALLVLLDPEFSELFKVQADFEDVVDRDKTSLAEFATLIRSYVRREGLIPPSDEGLACLLDEATRIADDARKLTLRLSPIIDILREAEHYARSNEHSEIEATDIGRSIEERDNRAARVRDRMHEATVRGVIMIDTDGARVGQINGLSVLGIGEHKFGKPSRITARTRVGAGKLVDIEREVELGGPLHSKGVMILSGYLATTYALDVPLSLHASLVFEQSYGGVEGDSASCAELCALLSSLAALPISQGLAVTGSVNQLGQVQAVGGVNEKIEGFFDICVARGLTGDQGVLIPATNVEHLMLRDRVVDAARAGLFRIIPIEAVDEAIELLTGIAAGARGEDGEFPVETVNGRVEARLRDLAQARREFATHAVKSEPGDDG